MRKRNLALLMVGLIVTGLLLSACSGSGTNVAVAASGIPDEIVCQCSCETILSQCVPTCEFDTTMLTTIGQRLDAGQPNDAIIQYFVDRYGSGVLVPRAH
jgi:cytochrome c-type biogenesis protein CcmH/NrfF